MTSITRYILWQCLGVMVFVTAALSAAVWLAQSLRLIDLIVNRGMSVAIFIYLALLILPRFLNIVLPIGVFIAVLFVFNRLSGESELVVMRAAGVSPLALAKPVLMLAGIAFVLLMSLSAYFLPASNREFKDLEFDIRNRFVSTLIQEGTFTTISDKLTIYVGGRNARGEVLGLLINDDRDPQRPVTIIAERGAFAEVSGGSRLILVNGNRQQYDYQSKKMSMLTFDRYTLDLDTLRDAPVVRFREAPERFLTELFFPPPTVDGLLRRTFMAEGNQRIATPLSAFTFAILPLACLLPGQLNRRGQQKRVLLAIILAFAFQALDVALKNLTIRYSGAIPFLYLTTILPFVIGLAVILHRGIGFGLRRPFLPAHAH
ncbi:MAG TPA: LPS export ABC transporter permease LptF [Stellaceae bacterium]|nr:LPS export ABC transporter permease LptF [Stellaceae bacterium]